MTTDELMLMTTKGQSVRIRVCDIRETGRNAQGVKLMGLKEGETIQDVATISDEEETTPADEAEVSEVTAETDAAPAAEADESAAAE
jgi:DNA gyrase subunit A